MKIKFIFSEVIINNIPEKIAFSGRKRLDICFLTIYILVIIYLININYRRAFLLNKDFFLHPQPDATSV